MKTVITYGTFDLLHIGHINLLQRARALGDKLIVALSTDEFNATMKDKHCIQPYEERKIILESLMFVDMVIPEENWEQKIADVQKYDANVFVIGKDWEGKFDFLKEHCEVVYLERTEGISTTERKNCIVKYSENKFASNEINMTSIRSRKKNCAVVFCITQNLTFAVANVIIGLKRYSQNLTNNIYIYHNGITASDKVALLKIAEGIVFIEFTEEQFLKRIVMNPSIQRYVEKLSYIVFAKFEAIDLLQEYHHIVILGADLLIQKDISSILESEYIAWRPVQAYNLKNKTQIDELSPDASAPNGCLLHFSDRIIAKQFTAQKCYDVLCEYSQKIKYISDEVVYGIIAHLNRIPITELEIEYNCWPTYHNSDNAFIIHAFGPSKFWNNRLLQLVYREWCVNNNIWANMGGSQYKGTVDCVDIFNNNREQYYSLSNILFWKQNLLKAQGRISAQVVGIMNTLNPYIIFRIPSVNSKNHFELSRVPDTDSLKLSLHCEDKTKITSLEMISLFKSVESATSDLGIVFTKDNRDSRLECAVIVKIKQAIHIFNQFIERVYPLVSKTLQRLYNVSNVTIDDFETFGVPTSTVKTNAQNLEHCLRYDAQMTTASYISRNAYKCKKFQTKYELLSYALQHIAMDGIIAEFGVAKGNTLKHIIKIISDKDIYGFDSFEGLPEDWRTGFMQGAFSVDTVAEFPEHIHLQKGYFEDTLPNFVLANHENCAFLHIDCDLYSSTKTIFKYLGHRIVQGSIIVFDEYFNYPSWQEHEFKAFKEYIEYSKHTYEYLGYVNNNEQVCIRITS